ncbi:MAG: YkgJ family cysteine cluster protein [Candidatus Woesearchaeota archaeon]
MTICDGPRADYCKNACCYLLDKPVTELEANTLGSHGAIRVDGEWRLRNDPVTGACVYLDIANERCSIYGLEKRPAICDSYTSQNCQNDGNRLNEIVRVIGNQDIRTAASAVDEIVTTTMREHGIDEEEALKMLESEGRL